VAVCEHAGHARFVTPHTLATESGLRLEADRVILCTGGTSRRLSIPGFELTATHGDAWSLSAVPPSMLVIGGGATGAQVASIFSAFGTRVQLFQAGPRILPTEDEDVSATVAAAFRAAGIDVQVGLGEIERFEQTPGGVRMVYAKDGVQSTAEAALAVVAVGWVADTAALRLATPGVATNARGFVQVDAYRQTSAAHVFAAGDVTGRLMLVPQAIEDGHTAATNAVRGLSVTLQGEVAPIGSFTDPEYAQVGLTEARAREAHDIVVAKVRFDQTTRMIIDGRTLGFCKLIADRATSRMLGCHVVGERAVEIAQAAAIAMAADMRVDDLARVPLSFPTYAGILGRAAYRAAHAISPALAASALQEDD
jgi:dihydrolipoamide dehydrogenase